MRFARVSRVRLFIASIAAIALGGVGLVGRQAAPATLTSIEVMIPMRDGVRLHTLIVHAGQRAADALPFLFPRTPYGIGQTAGRRPDGATPRWPRTATSWSSRTSAAASSPRASSSCSSAARRKDPKAIDESTDTYDTIEWLLKNVPDNNGRVGMLGIVYPAGSP